MEAHRWGGYDSRFDAMGPDKGDVREWLDSTQYDITSFSHSIRQEHLRMTRAHMRYVSKVTAKRTGVACAELELFWVQKKNTKGEARGSQYPRLAPGFGRDDRGFKYSKKLRNYLEKKHHPIPRKARLVSKRPRKQTVVVLPWKGEIKEFFLEDTNSSLSVYLHEYKKGHYRVTCDALPNFPRERKFKTRNTLHALSCFNKWVNELRGAWGKIHQVYSPNYQIT